MQIFKTMKKMLCVDKALLSDGKNTVQAKQWLDECCPDSAPSETTFKRWYADFKRVVLENTKNPHKLVLADCKLKLHEIEEESNQQSAE